MKKDELSCSIFVLLFALIVLSPLFLFGFAMWCDKVDRDRIADVASKYNIMTRQSEVVPQKTNVAKANASNEHSSNVTSDEESSEVLTFSDWLKTPVGSTAKRNVVCFMNNFPKLSQPVKAGLSEHILKQKFMHNDACVRILLSIDENFERYHNAFTEVYVRDEMICFVANTFYGNVISTCELMFN